MTPDQAVALDTLFGLLTQGGLLMGAIILIVLLFRDTLVAGKRLTKAEAQRDEAVAGWKAQSEATKEVTELERKTLEYLQDALPLGTARRDAR